jgi:hypothetical protein
MSTKITLNELPRALAPYGASLTYTQAWRGVTNGKIPAERVGCKWKINAADLPAIALSLTGAR